MSNMNTPPQPLKNQAGTVSLGVLLLF